MKNKNTQTGFGFDSHLFSKSGTLVLGGLKFPGTPALKGHSDGDALIHALVDSLLGSAALGDIGQLYPDSDPKHKGLASTVMLVKALSLLRKKKWALVHVDVTVLAEKPRLSVKAPIIRKKLSSILGIPVSQISLKAKTQEGLALFKKPGGIAVWAVATVAKRG